MKPIEELLQNLARPEVLEFGLVTNRLPSVNVGGRFEPVDDEAPTTARLLEILSTVGGSRHVETLGDKPVQWTTRVDGIGVIAVAAIMRKDVIQARFTVARRDAASRPQRAAGPLTSTQTSIGQTPREPSPAAPPVAAAAKAQAALAAAGSAPRQASNFQRTMPGTGAAPSAPAQAKPAGPQVRPSVQPPKLAAPTSSPSLKVSVPPPPTTASAQPAAAPAAAAPPSAVETSSPSQTDPSPTNVNPLAAAVPPPDDWDDDDEPTVQTLSPPLSASEAKLQAAAEPKPKPPRKPAEVARDAPAPRTERQAPPARKPDDTTAPQPAAPAAAASDVEITRNLPNAEKLALDLDSLDDDDDDGNTVEITPSGSKLKPAAVAQGPLPADAAPQTSPSAGTPAATPEQDRPRGDAALEAYLGMAVAARATDIHVVAGRPLLLRVASDLMPRTQAIEPAHVERIVSEIVPASARARLESEGACDVALEHPKHGRFRVNVSRQRSGYKLSMRVVPREPPTRASLGLPDAVGQVAWYPSGLVLVTAPSGHGKSSTVAAIIDQINAESSRHVVTVEDPIEHVHPKKRGLVSQREVGTHARSAAVALRAALREDPDVLSLGELRDAETARLAFDACDAGAVVLATVAAASAAKAVERIVDLFPAGEQPAARLRLAGSLRVLFGQRLVPSADRTLLRAAVEVLPWSLPLYAAIRDGGVTALQARGKAPGAVRLDEALAELVRTQRVTLEVAKQFAEVPQELDVRSARGSSPGMAAVRKP